MRRRRRCPKPNYDEYPVFKYLKMGKETVDLARMCKAPTVACLLMGDVELLA